MHMIAGCDGGGSKCHVRVAVLDSDGAVLQMVDAVTGPANISSDPDLAMRNISAAIRESMEQLEIQQPTSIKHIVCGLAGAGDVSLRVNWQRKLSDDLAIKHVAIVPDVEILFAAGEVADDEPAIALVVGTGSIAWSRDGDGRSARAGGLGPEVGDQGSALWIGREAIQRLGAEFQLKSSASNSEVAKLCPRVFASAKTETKAREIIDEAADHVAQLLIQCGRDLKSSPDSRIAWLCAGGVALNAVDWLGRVQGKCEESRVYLAAPQLIRAPVAGALNLALRML